MSSMKYKICAFIVLVAYTTSTSAFFLNWGSPEPVPIIKPQQPQQQQWPTLAYYQRVMQQPQYVDNNGVPVQQIPAIPIQVPLQAQLAPANSVHNVQLVPCLCPVAQDMEYADTSGAGIPVSQMSQMAQMSQMKQQQQQQVQQLQQLQQLQQPKVQHH